MKELEKKSTVPKNNDNLNWSQKYSRPIRPQKPSDNTISHERWQVGELPAGGYRSVFDFSDKPFSSKISNTSKPGNAGGKDIF